MKLTAILVESLDGFTSRGNEADIYSWTSPEDSRQFFTEISQAKLIIMGSRTYLAVKPKIVLSQKTLRLVLTHHPEIFNQDRIEGQLEFVNQTPMKLVNQLQKKGYSEALLVGGSQTLTDFLVTGLVTELKITLEPILLGAGRPLTIKLPTGIKLKLKTYRQLNDQGSLLLTYEVV